MAIVRVTHTTMQVLTELMGRLGDEWYGAELCKATGLPGGSLYPILARLETEGWVVSRWEEPERHQVQHRPRRRYYLVTSAGAVGIRRLMARGPAARSASVGSAGMRMGPSLREHAPTLIEPHQADRHGRQPPLHDLRRRAETPGQVPGRGGRAVGL
jgi:DNA-binding PadR family transcriptional regulator